MKMDSVNTSFGSRVRFKDAETIVGIARTATPQQYHGLLKAKPDLVAIGDDKLVEHSIEYKKRYGKQKTGNLGEKVFRLVTSYKKHPQDEKPAYTFKSKSLTLDELKTKAQEFVKAAEIALNHKLSQQEIDKVGSDKLERYARLKSSQDV